MYSGLFARILNF